MEKITENTTEKRCYTVKELQEILGISRPTVYELLKKNEFRWIQIGTKYRISKKSFDEWLDQKSENGPENVNLRSTGFAATHAILTEISEGGERTWESAWNHRKKQS